MRYLVPLALFVVVVGFLAVGLDRDPRLVPSPLIGQPLPAFALPTVAEPQASVDNDALAGRVYLLNVWASWCVACREEHPLLVDLARRGTVELVGLNYKDEREAARAWLARRGDPYRLSLFDASGRFGLDLGVYGVPETFVVDAAGVIRYKHVGPLDRETLERDVLPLLSALAAGGAS